MKLAILKMDAIKPGDNIRQDITKESLAGLMNSIKEKGVLQPILVKLNGKGYDLVAGYRRFNAAKAIGLKEMPVMITDMDKNDRTNYQITENLQREDLNPIDEALAYQSLGEKFKEKDLCVITGKSKYRIKKILSLLNLCAEIKKMVSTSELSVDHAFVVSKLLNHKNQKDLVSEIKRYKYSVPQTEEEMLNYSEHIENAEFDKSECKACTFNGNLLKDLFDEDTDVKGKCLNLACFNKKIQVAQKILQKKLEKEGKKVIVFTEDPKFGSKDYKAMEECVDFTGYEAKVFDKEQYKAECTKTCPTFAVVITPMGKEKPVCMNKDCFKRSLKKAKSIEKKANDLPSSGCVQTDKSKQLELSKKENRVDLFKRSFYIGQLLNKASDYQIDRIVLHKLLQGESGNSETIHDFLKLPGKKKKSNWEVRDIEMLEGLTAKKLADIKKQVVLSRLNDYSTKEIQAMASEVKIDISKGFVVTEEYLSKYSKDGLEKLAKELKIKLGSLAFKEKKTEIIDMMLKTLKKGVVPKEMLK